MAYSADPTKEYILDTEASDHSQDSLSCLVPSPGWNGGGGGLLQQGSLGRQEELLHHLLAVVKAVKHFRAYMYG